MNSGENGYDLKKNLNVRKCRYEAMRKSLKWQKRQLLMQTVSWMWVQKTRKCENNEYMNRGNFIICWWNSNWTSIKSSSNSGNEKVWYFCYLKTKQKPEQNHLRSCSVFFENVVSYYVEARMENINIWVVIWKIIKLSTLLKAFTEQHKCIHHKEKLSLVL